MEVVVLAISLVPTAWQMATSDNMVVSACNHPFPTEECDGDYFYDIASRYNPMPKVTHDLIENAFVT